MRELFVVILLFAACGCVSSSVEKVYRKIVPGIPVGGKKRLGGLYEEVNPAKPARLSLKERREIAKAEREAENARQGWCAIRCGLGLLVGGFFLSSIISTYLPRKLFDRLYYIGAAPLVWGFIMLKIVDLIDIIAWLAVLAGGAWLLHRWKGKSLMVWVSKVFSRGKKRAALLRRPNMDDG